MLENLNDHIVVCGGGRTGRQVMEELLALGQDFVVIERDPQRLERIDEQYPEVLTMIGDATLDVNLRESGILKARALLSCLSADTDNVFVCLSARDLNPDLTIVARALAGPPRGGFLPRHRDPIGGPRVAFRASCR